MLLIEEVDKYLSYCKYQKELDDKTIKAYKADLQQFMELIGENEPNKEVLNEYLLYLHRTYRQKTVKRKIASVKALFHYLEEEEIIEVNPFHKVKTKFKEEIILPKIIPRQTIEQLLNHIYKERKVKEYTEWHKKIILRDIAVVETLFSTGLRISELCHLQSKYVDLNNGVLCIQGKGEKERYIQIGSDDVLEILKIYKKYFEEDIKNSGYFFVNRYGKVLSEQSARNMIHKYADEIHADINITPHMFRHSFATYLMEADVNIRYIQKMLGHASITTTQIYAKVTNTKLEHDISMFEDTIFSNHCVLNVPPSKKAQNQLASNQKNQYSNVLLFLLLYLQTKTISGNLAAYFYNLMTSNNYRISNTPLHHSHNYLHFPYIVYLKTHPNL